MATVYYDKDADFNLLKGKKIAIIGYGSQGHAHALNLRDSGAHVVIGTRPGGKTWDLAASHGWQPQTVKDAVTGADYVQILLPDTAQAAVWEKEIAPNIKKGTVLGFSHGFNIHFKTIVPPSHLDVVMVAPRMIGAGVRDRYVANEPYPCFVSVEKNPSGNALKTALSVACAIGATRGRGAVESSCIEEAGIDLFAEQALWPAINS